jgi:hypothetical protein
MLSLDSWRFIISFNSYNHWICIIPIFVKKKKVFRSPLIKHRYVWDILLLC